MNVPPLVSEIFLIFGGLGLFLFGMKMMMNGLEELAGNRMRTIIERATSNRFLGIGVGAIVTVLIQSSTATSVMAVGFINAGLMTLAQAITVIMGAHIGTTLTAHIFAFRIDAFAPIFIFIGLVMYLFMSKKRVKDIGYVVLGVGILFFGLAVMGGPLRMFAQMDWFQSVLVAFRNPFLAVLAGFVFTAVIQSSTAATGILIGIMIPEYGAESPIAFDVAAYLVLGISAGTTVTAVIASFAGKRESKRAALANLIFVLVGCVIFGVLIFIAPGILRWFQNTWSGEGQQLAMFYTFFKIGLTLLFLPFVSHLASLMYKIIPKRTKWVDAKHVVYMKHDSSQSPAEAIRQASLELKRMGTMALINLELAIDAFQVGNEEKITGVLEGESSVNYLNKQITSMLMELQNVESATDMKRLSELLYIAADLERISDHAKNIATYEIRTKKKRKLRLGAEAMEELNKLGNDVTKMITLTIDAFDNSSEELIQQIYSTRDAIKAACKEYTKNHIRRVKNEDTDPRGSVAFVNMLNDLERCADHADNIAYYFQDYKAA